MTEQSAVLAVSYVIRDLLQDYYELRCGHPLAVCGAGRLGRGTSWPLGDTVLAICNVARCGASFCGRMAVPDAGPFAGMRPTMYSRIPSMALTERPGGPADPRQSWEPTSDWNAYDNPALTLHLVGEDMAVADSLARRIREELDQTAHVQTPHGVLNGLRIGPPRRTARASRPRYELTLDIEAEYIRPTQEA